MSDVVGTTAVPGTALWRVSSPVLLVFQIPEKRLRVFVVDLTVSRTGCSRPAAGAEEHRRSDTAQLVPGRFNERMPAVEGWPR
jgi:hypothetical protein